MGAEAPKYGIMLMETTYVLQERGTHMMKMKGLTAAVFTGLLMTALFTAPASADDYVDEYEAYTDVINEYSELYDASSARFALYDLDSDDECELLIACGHSSEDRIVEIFTLVENVPSYAGSLPYTTAFYEYEYGDGLLASYTGSDYQIVDLVTLDGDEIDAETLIEEETSADDVYANDYPVILKPLRLFGSDYLLPRANIRYITKEDLRGFDDTLLRLARNEFYARHGRIFRTKSIKHYFESQPWYNGTIKPSKFNEDVLNDFEESNIAMIERYESAVG